MATNGYEDPNFIGFPKNHKRLINRIVPNADRKNKIWVNEIWLASDLITISWMQKTAIPTIIKSIPFFSEDIDLSPKSSLSFTWVLTVVKINFNDLRIYRLALWWPWNRQIFSTSVLTTF